MGSQTVGHNWTTFTFTFHSLVYMYLHFSRMIPIMLYCNFQFICSGFSGFTMGWNCKFLLSISLAPKSNIVHRFLKVKFARSCPTFCSPMDHTVHRILQARILEWVACPISRESFQPRDQTQVSHIADGFFTSWATRLFINLFDKWIKVTVWQYELKRWWSWWKAGVWEILVKRSVGNDGQLNKLSGERNY